MWWKVPSTCCRRSGAQDRAALAGTNDMTMDGSPLMDRLAFDNVFLNGGWCYGGFKAIPASGAAFARFVATGTPPDLIRHFNLGRFATGQLLDERGMGPFPVRH